jgi:hypothetical protein
VGSGAREAQGAGGKLKAVRQRAQGAAAAPFL